MRPAPGDPEGAGLGDLDGGVEGAAFGDCVLHTVLRHHSHGLQYSSLLYLFLATDTRKHRLIRAPLVTPTWQSNSTRYTSSTRLYPSLYAVFA